MTKRDNVKRHRCPVVRIVSGLEKQFLLPQQCFLRLGKRIKYCINVEILKCFRNKALSTGGQNIFFLCGLIVRVRVVPRRTVVGDIDRRFDNLSGSHHLSHATT